MSKIYSSVTLHLDLWQHSRSSNSAISIYEGIATEVKLQFLGTKEVPGGREMVNGCATQKLVLLGNPREFICSLGIDRLSFLERK